MNDSLLVAVVTGLCTAVPAIITCLVQNSATRKLVDYRLDQVESRAAHNSTFETRLAKLEQMVDVNTERWRDAEKIEL